MVKARMKGNKEVKKPKTEKPKGAASAYKQAQGKAGTSATPVRQENQVGVTGSRKRSPGLDKSQIKFVAR